MQVKAIDAMKVLDCRLMAFEALGTHLDENWRGYRRIIGKLDALRTLAHMKGGSEWRDVELELPDNYFE